MRWSKVGAAINILKMDQFANLIKLIPTREIASISGTTITPKQGCTISTFYTRNDVDPDERPNESSGNPFFRQSLKVFTSMAPAERKRFQNNRVLVVLLDTNERPYLWGTIQRGVQCTVIPYLNSVVEVNLTLDSTVTLL